MRVVRAVDFLLLLNTPAFSEWAECIGRRYKNLTERSKKVSPDGAVH